MSLLNLDNIKRDGVCAYIRETLSVRCLFNTYFKECLVLEVLSTIKWVCNIIVQVTYQTTDA